MPRSEDWEDAVEGRIKTLEATVADKDEQISAHVATIATYTDQVGALKATVDALTKADEDRKTTEASTYVDGIAAAACEAGDPITSDKLERVKAAFARGDADMARELGDAYLSLSKVKGGGAVGSDDPTRIDLNPKDKTDEQTQASIDGMKQRWGNRLKTLAPQGS